MEKREAAALARKVLDEIVARLRALGVPVDEAKDYQGEAETGPSEEGKQLKGRRLFLRWGVENNDASDLPGARICLATYPKGEDHESEFMEAASISCDVGDGRFWMYHDVNQDASRGAKALFPPRSRVRKDTTSDAKGMVWVDEFAQAFLRP